MSTATLAADLRQLVGDGHVLTDPDVTASYATDWTGRFAGNTPLVVRPGSTAEVAEVLALANAARVAAVPQGGNTGLVGGSVPLNGELVLSLRRLNQLGPIDLLANQASFGAGVTLGDADAHAASAGLAVGVDLAARASATIGGMAATNAGGIHVLRYGAMRDQVVGVEAVLADGSVIRHMEGLTKDNTGYDLAGLLVGSEGTLAVITEVRLKLHPRLANHTTALVALPHVDAAVAVAAQLVRTLRDLHAIEAVFCSAMDVVCDHLEVRPPVGPDVPAEQAVWLLVEAAGTDDPTEQLGDALAACDAPVDDVAVATDPSAAANLWRFREHVTEAINALGTPHKLDVTLAAGKIAEFVARVPDVVLAADPTARPVLFGHLGDGNIHVNVLGKAGAPPDEGVDDAVLHLVAELDGSISAEHGIGTAKRGHLHLNRSAAEIAAFRAIKSALDPNHILNPNVLLPPDDDAAPERSAAQFAAAATP